jgi:energy-converting hydrogenase Eha subunit E
MVTKATTFGGAFLLVVGLLGFAAPGFIGMHLSALHNLLLLLSGTLAIYFGLKGTSAAARTFCLVFGAVYGLLGLVGFLASGSDYTLTIIPGALVLGTMDHVFHLVLGTVFLSVGWAERVVTATAPTH